MKRALSIFKYRIKNKKDKFDNIPLEWVFIYKNDMYKKIFNHMGKNLTTGDYYVFLINDKVKRI